MGTMEYDSRTVAEHKVAKDAWMTIHGKGSFSYFLVPPSHGTSLTGD